MRTLRWLPLALSLACTSLAGAGEAGVKLPDIGSSAGALMSPQDMRDYGASMLHEMRAYNLVLDDPQINDYLNALGYRLVAHSSRPDLPFTFFVVRDNDINAFAAPGGYIAANVGLIIAMDTEDEFAAVLGHEIAHVTQQHLLRAFEDAQKSTIPIALAMLGAIIVASGRNDDSAQAAIMTGTSLIQQRQINFTRQDESEADRVGIQTLARAGFDPSAMANTFSTMQRVMRVNGVDVPEFLRTHPVDTRRIADAKSRAGQLAAEAKQARQDSSLSPGLPGSPLTLPLARLKLNGSDAAAVAIAPRHDSRFELMRERARVLAAPSPDAMRAYYAENLRDKPDFDTPSNRYGYALALVRAGQAEKAVPEMEKLVAGAADNSVYQLGLAHALDQAGQRDAARDRYERLAADYPGNRAVALAYADSMLNRADASSAARARDLLRPLLANYADDPELQTSFARSCELSGDKVRAAEAYAEATYLNGRAEDALNQLKALLKQSDLDYYQRTRVDARITQMTPLVLELRRRGMRGGSDGSLAPSLACCSVH